MASNRKRSHGPIKAYDMGEGEGPIVPLTVMHRKRITSELHESYFRLMTIKPSDFKDPVGVCVGVELLFNSVEFGVPEQLPADSQRVRDEMW